MPAFALLVMHSIARATAVDLPELGLPAKLPEGSGLDFSCICLL